MLVAIDMWWTQRKAISTQWLKVFRNHT